MSKFSEREKKNWGREIFFRGPKILFYRNESLSSGL